MENIVFDLGGVLFARDRSKCTQEFHDFFSFIRSEPMPAFWEDYDRGVLTLDEVTGILSGVNACPRAKCEEYLRLSIDMQEPVKPTEQLVRDLKAAGYKFGDDGMLSDETPITVEYLTNNGSTHIAIAEAMQQDLAALGIEMTIQSQDWNVFLEERKNGNYDFCREGWLADFNDPINMLEMWITDSGNNDCQYGRVG